MKLRIGTRVKIIRNDRPWLEMNSREGVIVGMFCSSGKVRYVTGDVELDGFDIVSNPFETKCVEVHRRFVRLVKPTSPAASP